VGMQDKEADHFIGAIRGRDIYRNLGGKAGELIAMDGALVHQQTGLRNSGIFPSYPVTGLRVNEAQTGTEPYPIITEQETRNCSAMGGSSYYNSHGHTHTFGQAELYPTEQERRTILQRIEYFNNPKTLIQKLQSECNEWLEDIK